MALRTLLSLVITLLSKERKQDTNAIIHAKFMPPLTGVEGKMSSSNPDAAILMTDSAKEVKRKINKYAFSGGKDTAKEHRKYGGNVEIDVACQWLKYFEFDDKKLEKIYDDYSKGKLLSGEVKKILIDKINEFLAEHQKRRANAPKLINKFIYKIWWSFLLSFFKRPNLSNKKL